MYIGTRTSVADDAFLSKYTISIRINYWNNYYYKTQHGTYIYILYILGNVAIRHIMRVYDKLCYVIYIYGTRTSF